MNPAATIRRAIFWLACFGSIVTLLGHLGAAATMAALGRWVWAPTSVVMAGAWLWARRDGDETFLAPFRAGLVGGLWGTLGYDLVRIPFHALGQNPFAPIRAYGMWLAAAGHSTTGTDALGILFHFSNGITFGWIYAFLMLGRRPLWGVLWGLALESIAVASPFGEVFSLRTQYGVVALAYFAHLFYGYPLGAVCRNPQALAPPSFWKREPGWVTLFVTALIFTWLLSAWQPPGKGPRLPPATLVVGPDALYPGWTDLPAGSGVRLRNVLEEPVTLLWRRAAAAPGPVRSLPLAGGGAVTIRLEEPGIHQIGLAERGWRSVFLSVYRPARSGRDYRPGR